MNMWSETRLEYREPVETVVTGPLERLWQSNGQETVFLSAVELTRREHAARTTAASETESRLKLEYESALAASRRELIHSLAAFQADRAAYFQDMEREVVRLALAIGRTVIEKELATEPNLLEEAARDVLQRIERGSKVILRVPQPDVAAWEATLTFDTDRGAKVEFVGEPSLRPGQCTIETSLGKVEFNIEDRFREIEAALLQCCDQPDASRARPVIVQ